MERITRFCKVAQIRPFLPRPGPPPTVTLSRPSGVWSIQALRLAKADANNYLLSLEKKDSSRLLTSGIFEG